MGPFVASGIGDAFGAGFEYVDARIVRAENHLTGYRQHQKWKDLVPSKYTDDVQMESVLGEFMLSGVSPTLMALADAFVARFKEDPRPGYAGGFYKLLQGADCGADLISVLEPHSRKNGGAMRAPPVGALPTVAGVIDYAMWQASLTHATYVGMTGAVGAALLAHYFYHHLGPREGVADWMAQRLPGVVRGIPHRSPVGSNPYDAVKAAVTAIQENNTLSGVLHQCIAVTGDVDTVAAIGMFAAALCEEIEQDLPAVLVEGLENGPFGHDYLVDLDRRFLEKYPRQAARLESVETR